ncbi:MAG: ATP-dependent Clp protease ATP-binding subunit [Patescibacteria group bacterium]|nr:ATP-dependent Clp protease ATP-binding subunit [Patescibacteria group bacterium]
MEKNSTTSTLEIKPEGTLVARVARLDSLVSSFPIKTLFFLIWLSGFLGLGLIIFSQFQLAEVPSYSVGLSYILVAITLAYWSARAFYLDRLKNYDVASVAEAKDKLAKGKTLNAFSLFSLELAKTTSKIFSKDYSKLTTKDLAISILNSSDANFLLIRLGIGRETLLEGLKEYPGESKVAEIISQAFDVAVAEGHATVEVGDVLVSLCRSDSFFKEVLSQLKLEVKDIANVVYWQTSVKKEIKNKHFLDTSHLKMSGGIGKDWAFGYAPFLKQFSVDMTESLARGNLGLKIIGHDRQIEEIKESLLKRNGGNAIVVGEPGVGKETTILGFTKKVLEGQTNSNLDFKHIVKIDTDLLLSGLGGLGDITERITGIFNEASSAGNIIIYIENIQNLLSSDGGAGKVNAGQVIIPFLESPEMHVIGTCDVASFNRYISPNAGLVQHFSRITIDEPKEGDLVRILEDTVPMIEYRTGSIFSYEAIREAISASKKYIMDIPNPEKSIDLLDAVSAKVAGERGKTIILPKDVLEYVSEKYNVPSGDVNENEKKKLLSLESLMHQKVIGQHEAISAIANALRRVRAGITDSKKPIGSFLFLGPTGVGKTETSKALAEAYFGGADRMIRFDMSEYQNAEDIYRFIGSGQDDMPGELTTAVREKPFALLLFDELEKANKQILDLFLQILDEGFVTDGSGRKVMFTNTIIIATSNAGANLIRESIKSGAEYDKIKKALIDYLESQNIYRPEFINRFSGVIAFSPLSQEEITQIAGLMIEKLKKTVYDNKKIKLEVASDAIVTLSQMGFDPQMGARPMARTIEEKVENVLATKILSGELKKGDTFTINAQDIR